MHIGLNEPKQERSRRALDRLVNASIDLMSQGSFDEAPISEIIKKADYSVGAFYGRFDGKHALFHLVQERVLEQAKDWVNERISQFLEDNCDADGALPMRETARFIVNNLYALYMSNRGAYRAVFLHTRIKRDAALTRRVHEFNQWGLQRTSDLFDRVKPQSNCDNLRSRWALGLEVIAAHLREKILFGAVIPTGDDQGIENDLNHLAQFYLCYLRGA